MSIRFLKSVSERLSGVKRNEAFLKQSSVFVAELLIPANAGTLHPKGGKLFEEREVLFGSGAKPD